MVVILQNTLVTSYNFLEYHLLWQIEGIERRMADEEAMRPPPAAGVNNLPLPLNTALHYTAILRDPTPTQKLHPIHGS